MDSHQFDELTRRLSSGLSRRAMVRGLAGAALGGLLGWGGGSDTAAACPRGAVRCPDGTCVDLRTDPANCGRCGRSCDDGQVCFAARCRDGDACPTGFAACGTSCIRACAGGQVFDGACECVCPVELPDLCNGACRNLLTDPNHCGGCGWSCPGVCQNGSCLLPNGAAAAAPTTCLSGIVADGVCCDEPCDGQCFACNLDGMRGACTPLTGTPCDDGDACTRIDNCQAGLCVGGDPVVCPAMDQCHDPGTCDSATGLCSNPLKENGAGCDAGNPCTEGDTCQQGECQPGTPVDCSHLDSACAAGVCDQQVGCVVEPINTGNACDNGDPCVTGATCRGGTCVPGATVVGCCTEDANCDDGNLCTSNICDTTNHICQHQADPSRNGAVCGTSQVCCNGSCIADDKCCENTDCTDPGVNTCGAGGTCCGGLGITDCGRGGLGNSCCDGLACGTSGTDRLCCIPLTGSDEVTVDTPLCATDEECCPVTPEGGSLCGPIGLCCRAADVECTGNFQCCSGICANNRCQDETAICGELGDTDCTSDSCCDGLVCSGTLGDTACCIPFLGLAGLNSSTPLCVSDAECCGTSGGIACGGDGVCCRTAGVTCQSPSQCCSGVCTNGQCEGDGGIACDELGTPDCNTGGLAGSCCNGLVCGGTVGNVRCCLPVPGSGATPSTPACTTAAECCPISVEEDVACRSDGVCCISAAAGCSSDAQCCSGLCANGVCSLACDAAEGCSLDPNTCGANGTCCGVGITHCVDGAGQPVRTCCDGLVCGGTLSDNACCIPFVGQAGRNTNTPACTVDTDCCQGAIPGDVACRDSDGSCCIRSGAACTSHQQCCSGTCSGNQCQ